MKPDGDLVKPDGDLVEPDGDLVEKNCAGGEEDPIRRHNRKIGTPVFYRGPDGLPRDS